MAHDVFISYDKADKAVADDVCTGLESAGIKCWIAHRDVVNNWGLEIIKSINSTKVVVLVLSSASNESTYVMKEVERAVSKKIPICTLRIEEVLPSENLELFISSEQWLDMWGSTRKDIMQVLIDRIKLRLPPSPESGEKVTPRHIALAYNCWRKDSDPRFKLWDEKFKQHIYRLDLSVETSWNVLKRIDYVEYFLHPSWKAAGSSSEYKIDYRESNYRLKELIWGNFLLYAEVHLNNQDVIPLSCYVQLPAGKGVS